MNEFKTRVCYNPLWSAPWYVMHGGVPDGKRFETQAEAEEHMECIIREESNQPT